jgi:hypothetical protein
MRSLLGRPRAILRDAANLAGAPDDARVRATVIPKHGRRIIEIHAESEAVVLRVLLYRGLDGKVILEDDRIDVGEEFQHRGRGASLLGRQVEHAIRLGVAEIRAYAVRDDEMGMLGIGCGLCSGSTGHCRSRSAGDSRTISHRHAA